MKGTERARGHTCALVQESKRGTEQTYSHTQQARAVVLAREVLVREVLRPVDARAARAVAVQEIPALDHEVRDLPTPGPRQ